MILRLEVVENGYILTRTFVDDVGHVDSTSWVAECSYRVCQLLDKYFPLKKEEEAK